MAEMNQKDPKIGCFDEKWWMLKTVSCVPTPTAKFSGDMSCHCY
jgi:hypothetical protein